MVEDLTPKQWQNSFQRVREKQRRRRKFTLGPLPLSIIPHFDVMTISGHPGTGKTVIGESLADRFGADFIKIGDIVREIIRTEQGIEIVGYVDRPDEMDRQIDEYQREIFRRAKNFRRPVIVEGRLAAINATEILDEMDPDKAPRIVRVLFCANNKQRYDRIARRENSQLPPGEKLSKREVMLATKQREQGDLTQWRKSHPILITYKGMKVDSPFNPHLIDKKTGKHIFYDIVVNNTYLEVGPSEEATVDKAVALGFAERPQIIEAETCLPASGEIYSSI